MPFNLHSCNTYRSILIQAYHVTEDKTTILFHKYIAKIITLQINSLNNFIENTLKWSRIYSRQRRT